MITDKFLLLVLVSRVSNSVGFTLKPQAISGRRCDIDRTSPCNLLPKDAEKLVEAANSAVLQADEDASKKRDLISPLNAGRSLISRLFHLPSTPSTLKRNLDQDMDCFDDDDDDIVLYPIVGFQWFMDENSQCRALPTSQRAACTIPPPAKDMELVGWFHPAENME